MTVDTIRKEDEAVMSSEREDNSGWLGLQKLPRRGPKRSANYWGRAWRYGTGRCRKNNIYHMEKNS
jgi:hypothetical protein